jgi:hypothetical protein
MMEPKRRTHQAKAQAFHLVSDEYRALLAFRRGQPAKLVTTNLSVAVRN